MLLRFTYWLASEYDVSWRFLFMGNFFRIQIGWEDNFWVSGFCLYLCYRMMRLPLKCLWLRKLILGLRCFSCAQLTWFDLWHCIFTSRYCQATLMTTEWGVNPEYMLILVWPQNKKLKAKLREVYYFDFSLRMNRKYKADKSTHYHSLLLCFIKQHIKIISCFEL